MNRTIIVKHFGRKRLAISLISLTVFAAVVYAAIMPEIQGAGDIGFSAMFQGPARFTSRKLTTTPKDLGDWHSHPGYVFNVVTAGAITVEDGCGGEQTYSTGQAFEVMDGRVHRAKNEGDVDAVEFNMFVNPAGTPLTVFTGPPGNRPQRCGPPKDVDECKNDSWVRFDYPHTFSNQGECFAYVLHRPRIVLTVPERAPF